MRARCAAYKHALANIKDVWSFLTPEPEEEEDAQPAPKPDMTVPEVAKAQKESVRQTKKKFRAK
eukprot:14856034-Alexandrium_andersonii.AAC.1